MSTTAWCSLLKLLGVMDEEKMEREGCCLGGRNPNYKYGWGMDKKREIQQAIQGPRDRMNCGGPGQIKYQEGDGEGGRQMRDNVGT